MCKPKIGSEVRFTEKGSGVYFQMHGAWPANGGVLGVVESHAVMNIVTVRNKAGETEQFIWRFSDGLNDHFEWDGKEQENND